MSRYIDADKLVSILLEKNYNSTTGKIDFGDVIYLVNSQPTADVQEVKHGKWIKHNHNVDECSECGCSSLTVSDMDNCYCPHCGAKMDKESG